MNKRAEITRQMLIQIHNGAIGPNGQYMPTRVPRNVNELLYERNGDRSSSYGWTNENRVVMIQWCSGGV